MTSRTIAALRRLAERPGTEHEGKVARAMLERAGGAAPVHGQPSKINPAIDLCNEEVFRAYLRREVSID